MPLEKNIEATLRRALRLLDPRIQYLKLNVNGQRGWPDRLILFPEGGVLFLELKRPGEVPRELQEYIHDLLSQLGFRVAVADNVEDAMARIRDEISTQT